MFVIPIKSTEFYKYKNKCVCDYFLSKFFFLYIKRCKNQKKIKRSSCTSGSRDTHDIVSEELLEIIRHLNMRVETLGREK